MIYMWKSNVEIRKRNDKSTRGQNSKAQFSVPEYDEIKDKPGDSYYVRAMFDRLPDPQGGPHQLAFRKDDILFIDNTMYNERYYSLKIYLLCINLQQFQ